MSGPRMPYAKLPPFKYQTFDIDFVKFTNIPSIERKKAKEEKEKAAAAAAAAAEAAAAAPIEEPKKIEEEKKEEIPGESPLSFYYFNHSISMLRG